MDVPFRGKLQQQRVLATTVLLPFSGLKTIYVKYKIGGTGMIVPVLPLTVLALLVLRLFNWLIFGKDRHSGRCEREGRAGALHRVR